MQKVNYTLFILSLLSLSVAANAENNQPVAPTTDVPAAEQVVADNQNAPPGDLLNNPDSAATSPQNGQAEAPVPTVATQEAITRALQDDILFQRERRQLSNELALAKLRAELQKIREESMPAQMPVAFTQEVAQATQAVATTESAPDHEDVAPIIPVIPPKILLVSQVAGVSRVAVSVGDAVKLVNPQSPFDINGITYRLVKDSKQQFTIKEVK